MDKKSRSEIIDLNLGVDPTELLQTPTVSAKTQERIAYLMELGAKEMEAINKLRDKKREETLKKDEGIDRLFRKLVELAPEKKGLTTPELMVLAESDDHVSTMVRLHNYIKKRGNLWGVVKSKAGGKTSYRIIPTLPEDSEAS